MKRKLLKVAWLSIATTIALLSGISGSNASSPAIRTAGPHTPAKAALAPPVFTCPNGNIVYMVYGSPSALYAFDPTTTTTTEITAQIIPGTTNNLVSGIGYNVVDNYLWGHRSNTSEIVRIGSDGTSESFTVAGLPAVNTISGGEVSPDGFLYLYRQTGFIYKIDLNQPTPTLVQTMSVTGGGATEFAFNPADGNLYGIIAGDVYRYNIATGARTAMGSTSILPADAYSQVFFDGSGNMFAVGTEATFRIGQVNTAGTKYPTVYSTTTTPITFSGVTDMASCRPAFPAVTPQTPFDCEDGISYILSGSSDLYRVNMSTGSTDLLGTLPVATNAIGYNPVDNYIWGVVPMATGRFVARIGADGSYQTFRVPALPNDPCYTGDVSPDGYLYLYYSSSVVRKVNLNQGPDFLQVTDVPSATAAGSDWAFSPVDGQLYSLGGGLTLFRRDPATGVRTSVGTISGIPDGNYGAVFFDSEGNFYAGNSDNHVIYKVPTPHASALVGTVFKTFGAIPINDGARCPNSSVEIPPSQPFSCEAGISYIVSGTGLYRLNMSTGESTLVKNLFVGAGKTLNAMGYNVVDNYLWGAAIPGGNFIARVGANGIADLYAVPGLPTNVPAYTGDVSPDGFLYLYYSGGNMRKVNLNAGANFLQVTTVATGDPGNDWAFNPADGNLYSISGNTLLRHTPAGVRTSLGLVSNLPSANYGAVFFDNLGNMYVGNNYNQTIYKIPTPHISALTASVFRTMNTSTINDGARCPNSAIDAPVAAPFTCESGISYLVSGPGLFRLDMATGNTTLVGNLFVGPGGSLNGMGYNVIDNYIWGIVPGTRNIARVSSNGIADVFSVPGLPLSTAYTGDVSADGFLYLYYGDGMMRKVNLNAGANFLQVTSVSTGASGNDWAFNPVDGNLYSVIGNSLIRHTPAGVRTTVGLVSGLPSGNYGAVFFDNVGNMYAGNNGNKVIYKIATPHVSSPVATTFRTMNTSTINDGARCPNSPVEISGPVATDDFKVTPAGTAVEIDLLANDTPGSAAIDPASVKLIDPATSNPVTSLTIPGEGSYSVDPVTGKVTFTPEPGFTGNATPISYTVKDINGLESAPATISVTVGNPPVAVPNNVTTPPGTAVEIDVLTNDTPGGAAIDPTSVKLIDPVSGNPVTSLTIPGEGSYNVDPVSGKITFTPLAGFTGIATPISYTIKDVNGIESAPAGITVAVGNPPALTADVATTTPGTPAEIDVLQNDTPGDSPIDPTSVRLIDPSNNASVTSLTIPGEGTYIVDPITGKITFTPESGFTGTATPVSYTVKDETGIESSPATVTLTVGNPPVVSGDNVTTTPGSPLEVNVLGNDTQGDAAIDPTSVKLIDPLTNMPVTSVTVPGEGTYSVDPVTGKVTFTPETGFTGKATPISYTVKDVNGLESVPAEIAVTVGNPPVASPNTLFVGTPEVTEIDVLANDTPGSAPLDPTSVKLIDPNTGNPVTSVTVPGQGTYSVDPASGKITFTPEPGFFGAGTPVSYTVKDLNGLESSPSPISVTVETPPVVSNDSPTVAVGTPSQFDILTNDTPGGSPLDPTSVMLIDPNTNTPSKTVTIPGEGTFVVDPVTGKVTFTPEDGFTGDATTISYLVNSQSGVPSSPGTISVKVNPLPVTLVHFDAQREDVTVNLTWATTEETNSERFDVERSMDGKIWKKIGEIASHGESTVLRNYNFVDATPLGGQNFYRLRMVDLDGTFAFSSIRKVEMGRGVLAVYPNPAATFITVKAGGTASVAKVNIYNIAGLKVLTINKPIDDKIQLNGLSDGIYIVEIAQTDGFKQIQRLIISK